MPKLTLCSNKIQDRGSYIQNDYWWEMFASNIVQPLEEEIR